MTAHAGATFMTLADTPGKFSKTLSCLILSVSIFSAVLSTSLVKYYSNGIYYLRFLL